MDKNAALCVYLKKYHTGKEKAVPSTEILLRSKSGRSECDGLSFNWTGDENIKCPDRTAVFFAIGRAADSR